MIALAALLVSAAAVAAVPPAPGRWVTDEAGFLSPGTRDGLDGRLDSYQRATGHQVIVWIGTTIGGDSIDTWAAQAFKIWGVGRKGKDDGVGIFVLSQDRRMRIEVGYGLEGQLTDLQAAQIIRDEMTPLLQQGNRDGAVVAGVNGVLAALGGEAPSADRSVPAVASHPLSKGQLIVFGVLGLLLLGFLVTHPSIAALLLINLAASGRRGGGGGSSGGGGFSGGGGSSGGGGASGSW